LPFLFYKMKQIPLTQGQFALVDDEDFEELKKHKWYAYKSKYTFYAGRKLRLGVNKRQIIVMHRQILGLEDPKMQGDHIDWNGLNNQRHNLRIATNSQNVRNVRPNKNTSSKYKGVNWEKRDNVWRAQIQCDKRKIYIGSYKDEIEAAKAYDKKAKELFGEFAYLNFK